MMLSAHLHHLVQKTMLMSLTHLVIKQLWMVGAMCIKMVSCRTPESAVVMLMVLAWYMTRQVILLPNWPVPWITAQELIGQAH